MREDLETNERVRRRTKHKAEMGGAYDADESRVWRLAEAKSVPAVEQQRFGGMLVQARREPSQSMLVKS